eukprot:353105_1
MMGIGHPQIAILLLLSLLRLSSARGPYSWYYPFLECGQVVSGTLSRFGEHWYQVNLTSSTSFWGTFDTCSTHTNFSTILRIYGWNNLTADWIQIHTESNYTSCPTSGAYTTMLYNITSYADNGITNDSGTFIFSIKTNPDGFNYFSMG